MKEKKAWRLLAQLRQKRIEKLRVVAKERKETIRQLNSFIDIQQSDIDLLQQRLEEADTKVRDLVQQLSELKRVRDQADAPPDHDELCRCVCRTDTPRDGYIHHIHICGLVASDHTNHVCRICGMPWLVD